MPGQGAPCSNQGCAAALTAPSGTAMAGAWALIIQPCGEGVIVCKLFWIGYFLKAETDVSSLQQDLLSARQNNVAGPHCNDTSNMSFSV